MFSSDRGNIWSLIDCNGIRTHSHLVCKRTLNHFAKLSDCVFEYRHQFRVYFIVKNFSKKFLFIWTNVLFSYQWFFNCPKQCVHTFAFTQCVHTFAQNKSIAKIPILSPSFSNFLFYLNGWNKTSNFVVYTHIALLFISYRFSMFFLNKILNIQYCHKRMGRWNAVIACNLYNHGLLNYMKLLR